MTDSIHYSVTGSGKPVLLIHGWAMSAGVWEDFISHFCDCCSLVAVDLRGHGKSQSLQGPYTSGSFSADIARLIIQLGLKGVTLAGWSMGASVALQVCGQAAGSIDSLVLISGNPSLVRRPDYTHGIPEAAVRRLYRQVKRRYPEGLQNFYDLLLTTDERVRMDGTPAADRLFRPGQLPSHHAALESLYSLWHDDARPALAGIQVPTLIIHGDSDRICVPDAARYMHQKIRGSRLLRLEETGHVPFLARKDIVYRAVAAFLRSIAA